MAKSSNRGGGDGTSDRGGVRTTMTPAFGGGIGKGSQGSMPGPFNAPRSGGDNGLPTKTFDSLGGPKAGPAASTRDSLGTIKTNPKQRTPR
jgi:hypothetical protein